MSRHRLRTFTLWTGTLLCVLIAGAFVVALNSDSIGRVWRARPRGAD